MCSGGGIFGGGKPSAPAVQKAPTPVVAATPPPAEQTAEAPVVNENARRSSAQAEAARRGVSALKINLNLGGGLGGTGGTTALAIPK